MKNQNLLIMITSSLLLGIGVAFHVFVPGVLLGMKPDFILSFMFIAFLLAPKYSNAFIIGVAGGFLSGLTTSLPGGFLPNLVDKIVTMHIILVIFYLLKKIVSVLLKNKKFDKGYIIAPFIGSVGTIISGTVFLLIAILLGVLSKAEFGILFGLIVLPTTLANVVLTTFIYYILNLALNRGQLYIKQIKF